MYLKPFSNPSIRGFCFILLDRYLKSLSHLFIPSFFFIILPDISLKPFPHPYIQGYFILLDICLKLLSRGIFFF